MITKGYLAFSDGRDTLRVYIDLDMSTLVTASITALGVGIGGGAASTAATAITAWHSYLIINN